MNRLDRFKLHARLYVLTSIDFLNSKGKYCDDRNDYVKVHVMFSDGIEFDLSREEFEELADFEFHLGPGFDA